MNLVRSRLTADGDAIHAELGPVRLRLPDARGRLRDYVGREVILGLRPEDMEDAAFVPDANGSSVEVRISLAEALGSELIAHFPIAAEPVLGSSSLAAARNDDASAELTAHDSSGNATITARLSPRSRARTGSTLRVAIDVERLHFFDPETEEAIRE
jgi:multiple sugar transport system ATP-binding protein